MTEQQMAAMRQARDCDCSQKQEPVAWMRQDGQMVTTASDRHNYPDGETRYSIPLYTTPPVAQPAEFVCSTGLCHYRKPLTEHAMRRVLEAHQKQSYEAHGIDTTGMQLMGDSLFYELLGCARAIEAAHGITGETK